MMEFNITEARNMKYKTKWALQSACLDFRSFRREFRRFLETFYFDVKRKRSRIKTVSFENLISDKISVQLTDFIGRDGNVTLLESLVISSLIRYHQPNTVLEIGTFDGNTTLQMALNAPDHALIHTLDLPPNPLPTKEPISKADLKYVLDTKKQNPKYLGTSVESKIIQHFGDSTAFDFSKFTEKGPVDFIFIDAGHTYECVKSDTKNALEILSSEGVIIWHDYHPFWNGVFTFLNKQSQSLPIIRIADTNLAYYKRAN